jgi:hypothetical protein
VWVSMRSAVWVLRWGRVIPVSSGGNRQDIQSPRMQMPDV